MQENICQHLQGAKILHQKMPKNKSPKENKKTKGNIDILV